MNIRKQIRNFVVEEGIKFLENDYLPYENFNFPKETKQIYGFSREDINLKKLKELSNPTKSKEKNHFIKKKRTLTSKSLYFNTAYSKLYINKAILNNNIDISRIIIDKSILTTDADPITEIKLEVDPFTDQNDIINKN